MDRNTNPRPSTHVRGNQYHESPTITNAESMPSSTRPGRIRSRRALLVRALAGVIVVVLVALLGWWLVGRTGMPSTIVSDRYQAVFFTNGQVYFGKLATVDSKYLKLTDVFYIQSKATDAESENPQKTDTNNSNDIQLIKLGSEVHGPDDAMIISRDQVLFFENMKKDGTVSESIAKYKESNKN